MAGPNDVCVFHQDVVFIRKVLKPLRCVYIQFDSFPMELPDGLLKMTDPIRTENTIGHLAQAVISGNNELAVHFFTDLLIMHRYPSPESTPPDETVARCIAYFTENYHTRITLDVLSKELSISKQGLIQKFRRSTGKTPMEHLSSVRIAQSKRLLKDTSLPVSEIALRCGFENVYYFSNYFKRCTGLNPTGYRKLMAL